MRYAPSLFDKLFESALADKEAGLPGLSLEDMKDSVAADLETLLNTRSAMDSALQAGFPLAAASVVNFGVPDFADRSLSSGVDRDVICQSIQTAIHRHDRRLREVRVSLDETPGGFNRLSFTIRAILRVSGAHEQVSFDACFEPTVQRYSVSTLRKPVRRALAVQEAA